MTRGEAMRGSRRRAGLTLRQLSSISGVTAKTICQIENDLRNGSIATVEILADALGLSIDEYTGHEVKRHG